MPSHCWSPARRRYLLRFAASIAVYVILFALADATFHRHHPTGPAAIALALGPGIAIVAGIVAVGLYLAEEQDEFQRTLFIQSLLWGIGLTLAFTTVEGFLELFTPVKPFPLYEVFPFFWIVVGIVGGVQSFIYRTRPE